MVILYLIALLHLLALSALAQSTFSPGNIPLAARSSYLNARLASQNLASLSGTWPKTATAGNGVLGWAGYVKVDNATYRFLGASVAYNNVTVNNMATTDVYITPTRTVLTMTAGSAMRFNITFLSPIEVGDWTKWSRPFSYLAVEAESLDGASHNVQVYSDVSGEWLSGDRGQSMTWELSSTSPNIVHNFTLSSPQIYTDVAAQASWGSWYYATPAGNGVTYQIAADVNCRSLFQSAGKLNNTVDAPARAINNNWPVLAMAYDLGIISTTSAPLVWTIGFDRDPALKVTDLSMTSQDRALYYRANYTDAPSLVSDVVSDYSAALLRAEALDANLTKQATAAAGGGNDLANLVALSARQVIANTELTVGRGSDGSWNSSDVMIFMREGDALYNRTQPVELLYASFPLFMTLDPRLGAPLLEPLLRLQRNPSYSVGFAAQDLGDGYPNVTIENNQHPQGVEMTGNMLIMSYAQAHFSGDSALVENYYSLLRTWADYLVNDTFSVSAQLSTDTTTTRNQTNLAIKSIIGIKAFSQIASSLGVSGDASTYANQASNLYAQWKSSNALGSGNNLLATFGALSSYATGYNLFADKWLGLGVVGDEVYAGQTTLVKNLLSSGTTTYGIPVDSTSGTTASASWDMFVAGSMNDSAVSSTLIGRVAAKAGSNTTADIWPVTYDSSTGALMSGRASPGVGAVFAPLALALPAKSFSASSGWTPPAEADVGSSSGGKGHSSAGAIAGGVVGGLVALAAVAVLVWWLLRRRRNNSNSPRLDPLVTEPGLFRKNSDITPGPSTLNPELLMRDPRTASQAGNMSMSAHNTSMSALVSHGFASSDGLTTLGLGPAHSEPSSEGMGVAYSGHSGYGGGTVRPLPAAPMPLSSKALMELRRAGTVQNTPLGPRAAGSIPHSSGPESSSGRTTSTGVTGRSSDDVHARQLRAEVDLLRREMAEIRAAGLDLPPTYEAD